MREYIGNQPRETTMLTLTTVKRHYNKWFESGSTFVGKGGRRALLTPTQADKFVDYCTKCCVEGNTLDSIAVFEAALRPFVRESQIEQGESKDSMIQVEISDDKLRKMYNAYLPCFVRRADRQNAKRFKQRIDITVSIAAAATSYALLAGDNGGLYPDDKTAVHPSLIFNADAFSIELELQMGLKKKTRITKDAKAQLRGSGFGTKGSTGDIHTSYSKQESLKHWGIGAKTVDSSIVDEDDEENDDYIDPNLDENIDNGYTDEEIIAEAVDLLVETDPTTKPSMDYYLKSIQDKVNLANQVDDLLEDPPIRITPPGIQPGSRSLDRSGGSIYAQTNASGELVCTIITLKQNLLQPNTVNYYTLSKDKNIHLCIRSIKVDEEIFALKRFTDYIFPAMERVRENHAVKELFSKQKLDSVAITAEQIEEAKLLAYQYPMVFTADGCGPELNAMLNCIQDENLISILPQNTRVYKHPASGTALYQAHDAERLHSNSKGDLKSNKDMLREDVDDDIIPPYSNLVYDILTANKFKPGAKRTYYKFLINLERILFKNFNVHNIRKSYATSVQYPWNLVRFIQRWSGAKNLKKEDYSLIADTLPNLIAIAIAQGGIEYEETMKLLGNFIKRVNEEGLSPAALAFLTKELLTKPVSKRPINQKGAWILTNPEFLAKRRQKELDKLAEAERHHQVQLDKAEEAKLRKMADDILARALYESVKEEYIENGADIFSEGIWNHKTMVKSKLAPWPFTTPTYTAALNKYCPKVTKISVRDKILPYLETYFRIKIPAEVAAENAAAMLEAQELLKANEKANEEENLRETGDVQASPKPKQASPKDKAKRGRPAKTKRK